MVVVVLYSACSSSQTVHGNGWCDDGDCVVVSGAMVL